MTLTPLQKSKLIKYYPELRTYFDIQELKQKSTDGGMSLLVALINKLETLKGDKGDEGYTPVKGSDYFTDKEINQIIDFILKKSTPVKGRDYKDGEKGENGKSIKGDKGDKGDRGKDGSPDSPYEIVDKLNTLEGVLNAKIIRGIVTEDDFKAKEKKVLDGMALIDGRVKLIDQRWGSHGGGLSKVTTDATLTGLGTPASPLSVVSGGSLSVLTTSSTVNGSNTVFVFTTAPTVICRDESSFMQKTASDGTVNWTGTTTVTLTIAPTFDIFGL